MTVEIPLERLEELAVAVIVCLRESGQYDAVDLVADMMAALHFRRDDLVQAHQEKMALRSRITEVEEGVAFTSCGVPQTEDRLPLPSPPAGPIPAQAPPRVTVDAATQTSQEWATPPEGDSATMTSRTEEGESSIEASWRKVESALQKAKSLSFEARQEENKAGLLLDHFLSQGQEACQLAGNWPILVADRRQAFEAFRKERLRLKVERKETEAVLARAQRETAMAAERLKMYQQMEAEALSKLRAPFADISARPTPPPPASNPPPPEPTPLRRPGAFNGASSRPSPGAPNKSASERLRRPGDEEAASSRPSPRTPKHSCHVCGKLGVRRPRNCPNLANHPKRE